MLLRENDWKIPATRADYVCKRLGIVYGEHWYYLDIVVWLPDERWDIVPRCPHCEHTGSVHGWQTEHFGRIVVSLFQHYYVISRRYKCHHCKLEAKHVKEAAALAASHVGGRIDEHVEREEETAAPSYTFMGYNSRSRELLPDGLGEHFPAFLTHRGAVDMCIIDLMRALSECGLRPDQLASIILELTSKQYWRDWKQREHHVKRHRATAPVPGAASYKEGVMFGDFRDKKRYCAVVPSAKYLSHVFKLYHATIRPHFDREVNKRGAKYLRWDASYKEAKKLSRYRGVPVYKAIVTATNEVGEIRIQFHIVKDGHNQMLQALHEFQSTVKQYGHRWCLPISHLMTALSFLKNFQVLLKTRPSSTVCHCLIPSMSWTRESPTVPGIHLVSLSPAQYMILM